MTTNHDGSLRAHRGKLLVAARAGDQRAWALLIRDHEALLATVARRAGARDDDLSDVIQTTWLRCWENLHRIQHPEALTGWLCTTCRHESIRLGRERRRYIPESTIDDGSVLARMVSVETDPADLAVRNDMESRLQHAIDALPERQRVVLTEFLRHDCAPYEERSKRLGMPRGSLGPTRRRAIMSLRDYPQLVDAVRPERRLP